MKILNLILMLSFLLQSCGGKGPTQKDIVGKWKNADGAEFIFNEDGTFMEKSFPAEFVLLPKEEYKNVRFDGSGRWELKKDKSYWELYLDFKQVSDKKFSSAFPLLIAGKNGILDNKPPWYLFVWKEEEGGERYKIMKQ